MRIRLIWIQNIIIVIFQLDTIQILSDDRVAYNNDNTREDMTEYIYLFI